MREGTGRGQTSLLTDLRRGGKMSGALWQVLECPTNSNLFSISSWLITKYPYGDTCHCDHSKLAGTAGSASTVLQSHTYTYAQGTHRNKTHTVVSVFFNSEIILSFLREQKWSHSQEIRYHRHCLMSAKPNSCWFCMTLCQYDNIGRRWLKIFQHFSTDPTHRFNLHGYIQRRRCWKTLPTEMLVSLWICEGKSHCKRVGKRLSLEFLCLYICSTFTFSKPKKKRDSSLC